MSEVLIPGAYYLPIFLIFITLLSLVKIIDIQNMSNNQLLQGDSSAKFKSVLTLGVITIFLGLRPYTFPDSKFFGDTAGYALSYQNNYTVVDTEITSFNGDWLFDAVSAILNINGCSVSLWFTLILMCFLGCTFYANQRLFKNNVYIAILFVITSFGFFQDAVNGIRNSLACSMAILATVKFIDGGKRNKIEAIILGFLGTGIHTASTLLCVCALASALFLKDTRKCILIWVGCLAASFVVGDSITDVFSGLGFDERMDKYVNMRKEADAGEGFSHTGFRWDFILYSIVPICMGYYVTIKRKIKDYRYSILLNTYILANAFWLLVIRAKFSNRFAMISWALYSIIIAYPLLKYNIYNNQRGKVIFALVLFLLFTYYMSFK